MSDHKFEKQVGQKLADLKITPSTESWTRIENEIRKDRRRPAPVFWLPLLLIGLGAIGYFVFNPGDTGNHHQVAAIQKTQLSASGKDNDPASSSVTAPQLTGNNSHTTAATNSIANTKKDIISKNSTQHSVSVRENKLKADKIKSNKINEDAAEETNNENGVAADNSNSQKDDVKTEKKEPENKTVPAIKQQPATETAAAEPKKEEQKKKSNKWSFGVTGSAGVSAMTEGKLLDFSNPQVDMVAAPTLNLVSPAVLPSSGPSKLYPGLSFSLGVTAKRELSKRLSLSVSLNYLRSTIITKVGYKIQSTNNQNNSGGSFYLADRPLYYLQADNYSSEDYYNKFHFIELPVELNTRINKSKKLPIYWNAGFSVSQLIGSNSLHYDQGARVYYVDDGLFNSTQVAALTGFSFQLLNKTKTPLWIGPSVRYNISTALKKDVSSSNKHFMGAGLDVKWFIK